MIPKYVFRPISHDDLNSFYELILTSKAGLTSLPKDKLTLEKKINNSIDSFNMEVIVPRDELYLFVLEELETQARDKRHYELEDSIGRLIEDIIEDDIEQERQFRKEVSKYIDEKIESEIVRRAYASGSIAQA